MRDERRVDVSTAGSLTLADRKKREGAFNHTNEQEEEGRRDEEMDERGGREKRMSVVVVG